MLELLCNSGSYTHLQLGQKQNETAQNCTLLIPFTVPGGDFTDREASLPILIIPKNLELRNKTLENNNFS